MKERIAKQMIELILLQQEFDNKLNELGITINDNGEVGQLFLTLEDKTCDLLLEYMSISDDRRYDFISDIFQSETDISKIFHSLKKQKTH